MTKPKHILVIRLSAMGDVAMTVPVLRALVEQYPNIQLTVVTKPFFIPLFNGIPNVEVIGAEVKGKHKGIFGLLKLSKTIKAKNIDAVGDLHNVLRSKILKLFLFGKKVIQIDKGRSEKKALISGEIFQQLKTTHQRYADVFDKLGFTIDLSNPNFPEKAKLSHTVLELIDLDAKKTIGIAPFAAFKSKAYPLEKMEQVIALLSKSNYKVLLFGASGAEASQLERISNTYKSVINLAGKLSLKEEIDVISNLNLMVSMDSGNAHLAAMFGIPVITIWGVTHPYAGFYPFHQDENNAILADRNSFPKIPTSVYGNSYPNGYEEVFNSISPEDIIDKIKMILS